MSQHSEFNPHPLLQDYIRSETRRQFFKRGASLMGTAALAMLAPNLLFADDKKAEAFLKKALEINPNGIDANYFYGDFLYRKGHYPEALAALEKAMHAPERPSRPLADEGRRKEIQAIIAKIKDQT